MKRNFETRNILNDKHNTTVKLPLFFSNAGYQRELSFVHHDGSFSAFGTNDRSGTTW